MSLAKTRKAFPREASRVRLMRSLSLARCMDPVCNGWNCHSLRPVSLRVTRKSGADAAEKAGSTMFVCEAFSQAWVSHTNRGPRDLGAALQVESDRSAFWS